MNKKEMISKKRAVGKAKQDVEGRAREAGEATTNVLDEGVVVVGIEEEATDGSDVVSLAATVLKVEEDLNGLAKGEV